MERRKGKSIAADVKEEHGDNVIASDREWADVPSSSEIGPVSPNAFSSS
jgi:hypothetical protein